VVVLSLHSLVLDSLGLGLFYDTLVDLLVLDILRLQLATKRPVCVSCMVPLDAILHLQLQDRLDR